MSRKKKHHPRRKQPEIGTVTISAIIPFLGALGLILFLIPTIISLVKASWGLAAIFGVFDLFGIAMLLTANWRIEYNSFSFTHRNCFRVSRRYTYDQITAIHRDGDSTIRIGRKRIHIDFMADNGKKFLNVAVKYAHNAACTTAKDAKLFHGNVRNPGEFIFIWAMMGVYFIGITIFVIHGKPILHLEELASTETVLSGLEVQYQEEDPPYLKLVQNEETCYLLYRYETFLTDYEGLQADAEAGKQFRIYYETTETENSVHRYVRQLECGDKVYASLEQYNNETYAIWALFGVFILLWALFVAVSWYVMSHADRYPRLARQFVKPEYLVHK